MKTIIFSDTHLTERFNIRKFMFLLELIKDADRIIINGDFWDNTYTNFSGFVNSKWKLLFPLLKSKETIYLYGNHDPEAEADERVALFSDIQGHEYRLEHGGYELYITHGHSIREGMAYLTKFPFIRTLKLPVQLLAEVTEWLGTQLLRRFGKNLFLHRYLDNRYLKNYARQLPPQEYLVTGHTHLAFFNTELKFINTGSIRFGHAHYLRLDNEQLKLVYSTY